MVELFYEKLGKKVTQRCLENSHVSHLKDSTDFLENKAGNIEFINERKWGCPSTCVEAKLGR